MPRERPHRSPHPPLSTRGCLALAAPLRPAPISSTRAWAYHPATGVPLLYVNAYRLRSTSSPQTLRRKPGASDSIHLPIPLFDRFLPPTVRLPNHSKPSLEFILLHTPLKVPAFSKGESRVVDGREFVPLIKTQGEGSAKISLFSKMPMPGSFLWNVDRGWVTSPPLRQILVVLCSLL
ncbi:hypothetical protein BHE74_00049254 [Ensete ventricosum]|nr:hypothetical protein BHE74_00049254 [Ensete ventricosum]